MYRTPRAVHFMNLAVEHAKRSTCFRLNVGCLVADGKRILTLTHNGPPSGSPHCTGHLCEGATTGCKRSVHAEENALANLNFHSPTLDMFVSHSPCQGCVSQLLFPVPMVGRLFFQTEFRATDHLVGLAKSIAIYKVTPAGYVTTFPNGELIDPESLYQ